MNISFLQTVLWMTGLMGQCILLTVLAIKKHLRRFPAFTAYAAFQTALTLFLYVASRTTEGAYYPIEYRIGEGIDFVLQIILIAETAKATLRPAGIWIPGAKIYLVAWSVIGFTASGGLTMALEAPGLPAKDLWDMRADVFTSLFACTLVVISSIATSRLGLRRNRYASAIAGGYTFWATTAMIGDVAHMQMGWDKNTVIFDRVSDIVWVCVLGYWSCVFWRPGSSLVKPPTAEDEQAAV